MSKREIPARWEVTCDGCKYVFPDRVIGNKIMVITDSGVKMEHDLCTKCYVKFCECLKKLRANADA